MKKGILSCKCSTMNLLMPKNTTFSNMLLPKQWEGEYESRMASYPCGVDGYRVWTDGTNIYYTDLENARHGGYEYNNGYHVVLRGNKWEKASMNFDEVYFHPNGVWTDGTNIYMSYTSWESLFGNDCDHTYHYVLQGNKWVPKTWNFTQFTSNDIWSDGTNIYLTNPNYDSSYVLNNGTWVEKVWGSDKVPYGSEVWSDGVHIYGNIRNDGFGCALEGNTWVNKTWVFDKETHIPQYSGVAYLWTDGTNIYATSSEDSFILEDGTWKSIEWSGLSSIQREQFTGGGSMWTDGINIYFSEFTWDSSNFNTFPLHSILLPTTAKIYSRIGGSWVETSSIS